MRSSRGVSVAPARVYGVGVCAGQLVVHDPLTGMTHHRDQLVTVGRTMLRASEVAAHPVADLTALGGSWALGVRWSPVVRRDPSPSPCPRIPCTAVRRALACAGLLTVDLHEVEPLPTPISPISSAISPTTAARSASPWSAAPPSTTRKPSPTASTRCASAWTPPSPDGID